MKTIDQTSGLIRKRVLMRVDFDVPIADGTIAEAFRIERQRPQLRALLDAGARICMIAHISAQPSFGPLQGRLQDILGVQFRFLPSFDDLNGFWEGNEPLALLENLRTWPGEEAGDEKFSRQLAQGADLFVNNAFAVLHRPHASVVGVSRILPAYAGTLVVDEVRQLERILSAPAQGKAIFIGGAKGATKTPVIRHLIDSSETIAVGGVVANDIMKERGMDIDASQVDANAHELLAGLDINDARLLVPQDNVTDGGRIMDIGPQTAEHFAQVARSAAVAVWNGPMGKFEDPRFLAGSRILAQGLAASTGFTVIGGGDTIAAVAACGIPLDRFGHVCTGGGAMLAFLAGEPLPGLAILDFYAS